MGRPKGAKDKRKRRKKGDPLPEPAGDKKGGRKRAAPGEKPKHYVKQCDRKSEDGLPVLRKCARNNNALDLRARFVAVAAAAYANSTSTSTSTRRARAKQRH
mgnify:CR=1 FL=1